MTGFRADMQLDLRNLEYVRGSALNKAIRISLNKATVPVKAAVVATAPQKTGFLRKAMRIKTQFKKGVWAAVVGPSTSIKTLKKRKKQKPKAKGKTKSTNKPKKRTTRKKTRLGRFVAKARKVAAKRISRAKKVAAKKATQAKKRIVKSKFVKKLKKKFKRKPGQNDFIKPSRYGSILQFGSKKLKGRHYLERAYARCGPEFATILCAKLKEQLAEMMNKN